ncbi:MAG: hypothetical protein P4L85_02200 [Paludisphaera borealis]|uniref:hypothetical protein n=1 Tax=Paludisphaera borealis TaxID=1387353 RepID=UPI0028446048|nr:hypothetical protein [Paludisphaera borealis]MDR3618134.1 hypothetical protein [Paludisphaera borealis]
MPANSPTSLPSPLRYLQSFVRTLAKLPPDQLNEDIDCSRLETALRKRIRGLKLDAAAAELEKDRALLETWLNTQEPPTHPASWILGFLSYPDLATQLSRPAEPPPRGPQVTFDAPDDWKVKAEPFGLVFKRGKLIGTIMVIDESTFETIQLQQESIAVSPHLQASHETIDIRYGGASGKKYVFNQATTVPWKRVDYLLNVPVGFVCVTLFDSFGADFDEEPFESRLHTLRLTAPA